MIEGLGIGWDQAGGALLTFLLAGVVKGGIGFGLPLVTISILPLILPLDLALVVNALVVPVLNAWQVWSAGRLGEVLRRFWPLIATLTAFLPATVAIGTSVSQDALTVAVGLAVMGFTAFTAVSPRLRIPPRHEKGAAAALGVGAGIVGGLTTINGPFFLFLLIGAGADRKLMLTGLGVFFLLTGVLLTGSFAAVGLVDLPRVGFALACLVPAGLGMWVGNRLADRLSAAAFRKLTLGVLFVLGVNITLRGLL